METTLLLISMPWSDPEIPSIQTGILKAYIDSLLSDQVKTHTCSPFVSIPMERRQNGYVNTFQKYEDFEEYPYFFLCWRRFLCRDRRLARISFSTLLKGANQIETDERLTVASLDRLERRTRHEIERMIVPKLSREGLNVVGFTLNYYQLFASIFCVRYLEEKHPSFRCVFVFGGATVIYPKVSEVLRRFGVRGVCVVGEGERKLELIARECLNTPNGRRADLTARLACLHPGIYDIQQHSLNLYEPRYEELLGLQTSIGSAPLPDFREYYSTLRAAAGDDESYRSLRSETWLALEGTRGCFARCDFCDVHTSWNGFRRSEAKHIVDSALKLAREHRVAKLKFMDNVCDTWAEEYAEILIRNRLKLTSFMECRVHHPEWFWSKLALSGVDDVQVGIEAFSPSLLAAMNKGTRAKQNLLVQKWLKELGVVSLSNLISHHCKSTLKHVEETRKILELIPHLDRLNFSPLGLLIGSPLYKKLDPTERKALQERQAFVLPKSLDPYFVIKGEYEPPNSWFKPGVLSAWDDLIAWEGRFFEKYEEDAFMTETCYSPDQLVIRDGRYGNVKEHYLEGPAARLYRLCHRGPKMSVLAEQLGLETEWISEALSSLISKGLLVELEGSYIALALRPRDELIENCLEAMAAGRKSQVAVSLRLQEDDVGAAANQHASTH